MSEWKKVKLGDISSAIQTGPFGSQLHQSDYSDIGVPVVMPKDIINGSIDESTIARVESHHVERLSRHKISEGDILYARRGDVGKCAYTVFAQQGWLCGTGCLRVTIDKQKALPKFVFYQLQKRETIGWVEKHAIGATMLNLNTPILSDVPIDLPSLTTQHHIATILSRYDSLIENYQKQIKLLEEAAQRLYKEWFVDLHFPGHENTKIVDGVPEGWEKKKIADVCDTVGGGTPSTKVVSYYEGGTINWVTPTDITKNNSLCLLSTEQGFISCVPFEKDFQMYLLYNLINRVEEIRIKAGGSTYLEISKSVFRNFDIICPAQSVIKKFQGKAHCFLERTRIIAKQIRLLTEARDRLLPKLMNGEINVGEERPERPKSA